MTHQIRKTAHFLLIALFLAAIIVLASLSAGAATAAAPPPTTAAVTVETADDAQLRFTLRTPTFLAAADGHVTVAGLDDVTQQPGAPALPYYATYVALPPEADVSVTVETAAVQETAVAQVQPAPQPDLSDAATAAIAAALDSGAERSLAPLPLKYEADTAVYGRNALYPGTLFTVSEPMYMRDLRVVELKLYPLRYNPAQGVVTQAQQLNVTVHFSGAQTASARPATAADDASAFQDLVLNAGQAQQWRSLPQSVRQARATRLPVGQDTFKIEVSQDGIYEITGAELATAGMNLGQIDPATIEMLYRGEPVAYQFVDRNSNGRFDTADGVRFYGWAFDGPRAEKQFVSKNVFWLWAGGTPTKIGQLDNRAGSGFPQVTTFRDTITKEPENYFFSTWTDDWEAFPNDPDSYYWDAVAQQSPNPVTKTYEIDLPAPAPGGADATYLVEIMTRLNSLSGVSPTYTVGTTMNDSTSAAEETWEGIRNLNVSNTIPAADQLQPGDSGYPTNSVNVTYDSSGTAVLYLNRITVEYTRQLTAVDNQLIFSDENGGQREFRVDGFSQNNAAAALVWNISNPRRPVAITMRPGDIEGSGAYTYKIGSQHGRGSTFIAATSDSVLSVDNLSRYTPVSLDPPGKRAAWVAITHGNFRAAADQLAGYRATKMSTFVVNVADVINQYGYGLNTPAAIRDYLTYALGNWNEAPRYVTLIGDATVNPRNLDCPSSGPGACSRWNANEKTYVVTDMPFVDRYAGLIPSDYTMSLLSGDDLLPDVAIGRIPAATPSQANAVVQKIITYEGNLAQGWHKNVLFVADDADSGGNFCAENAFVTDSLPGIYNAPQLCLAQPTTADTNALRAEMGRWVNDRGISVLNYRGHGSMETWADTSNSPALLSTAQTDFWLNDGRPVIILSADCLDGYFAWPDIPALGETFFKGIGGRGSAAHWSSAGLGFTSEHTALHQAFYEAIFTQRQTAVGDAINYSKTRYQQRGFHPSELYAFILLGDPAMPVFGQNAYLPSVLVQ